MGCTRIGRYLYFLNLTVRHRKHDSFRRYFRHPRRSFAEGRVTLSYGYMSFSLVFCFRLVCRCFRDAMILYWYWRLVGKVLKGVFGWGRRRASRIISNQIWSPNPNLRLYALPRLHGRIVLHDFARLQLLYESFNPCQW